MTFPRTTLLVALAAMLLGACADDTPTPAMPDNGTDTPNVVEPYNDGTTTTTPDPGTTVADKPVTETDYCAELKAKNACGLTWYEVDDFLNFVEEEPIHVTLTCTSRPAIEACRVEISSNSQRFNGIKVYGQGLPTEAAWYDDGPDAAENNDDWDSRAWLQTTVHGNACLAVEDIDAGGGNAFREFLLVTDA